MLTSHYNRLKKHKALIRGHINMWLTLYDSCFTPRIKDTLDLKVFPFTESENIYKIINTDKHTRTIPTTWRHRSPRCPSELSNPGRLMIAMVSPWPVVHTQQHIHSVFKNFPVLLFQPYAVRLFLFILLHYAVILLQINSIFYTHSVTYCKLYIYIYIL